MNRENALRRRVANNFSYIICGLILLLVVIAINGATPAAMAQSVVASLSGRVIDQREAAITGAAVKILNPQTGFQREITFRLCSRRAEKNEAQCRKVSK